MRNLNDLHPDLQVKISTLKKLVKKELGIEIGISECLRTVAEQDALYAKGRTKPGSIVTNCKGSTYSSMHMWGIAFDFYIISDVDGDGNTSDDAFNNATKLFNKVGDIGKRIGLEWGGDWKSIVDLPHFQLPNWGSTTKTLKSKYGTPNKFFITWKTTGTNSTVSTTSKSNNVNQVSFKKLVMGLQMALNKEFGAKLVTDGLMGSKTFKALPTFNKNISKSKPLTTAAVQSLLNWHSCNCGTVDGIWGSKTTTAVKKFQTVHCGLSKADYEFTAGGVSWRKLLNYGK